MLGHVETTDTHFTYRRVLWRTLRIQCTDLERKFRFGWMTCSKSPEWIQGKGGAMSKEMRTAVTHEMNRDSMALSEDGPRTANAVVPGRWPRSFGTSAN